MKFKTLLPSLALLLAQIPVGWAVDFAAHSAEVIWIDEGGDMELPMGTILAIRGGILIPLTVLVASAVLVTTSLMRRIPHLGWLLGLAICESIFLAFFAFGLVIPGMEILYRMGNL